MSAMAVPGPVHIHSRTQHPHNPLNATKPLLTAGVIQLHACQPGKAHQLLSQLLTAPTNLSAPNQLSSFTMYCASCWRFS